MTTTLILLTGSAVIGVVAAWMAGRWMTGNGFGLLGDSVAGILGAVIGGYVLRLGGLNLGSGLPARLVVAFIGASIVLLFVHTFTGRRAWS